MLDHLGEPTAAACIVTGIEAHVEAGRVLTRDLGGTATTEDVAREIVARIEQTGVIEPPH